MSRFSHSIIGLSLLLPALFISGCNNNNEMIRQGYIEGDFTYVASQVGGTLNDLLVARGDKITKDQPLFKLDLSPQIDQENQAKANLAQAQSTLLNLEKGARPSELAAIIAQQEQVQAKIVFAKKTVSRYQRLVKAKVLQQSSLDKAVSNHKNLEAQLDQLNENLITAKLAARVDEINAAKASVKAATAALKTAEWNVQQKIITSPVNGIVYDRYFRTGEVVAPDQPVVSLLAPENVYLVFYAPEEQLARLKVGQMVKVTCDNCPKNITAKIRFLSPKAEFTPPVIYSEKTRSKLTYRIEANLPEVFEKTLHPGQPVTVDITPKG